MCDLFRTALFGPTNSHEDHLDDGLGNDLPRPMADAPATLGARFELERVCVCVVPAEFFPVFGPLKKM